MLFIVAYFCVVDSGFPIVNSALTSPGNMEDMSASGEVGATFSSASFPKSSIVDNIAKISEEEEAAHAQPIKSELFGTQDTSLADRSDIIRTTGLQNINPSVSATFKTSSPSKKPTTILSTSQLPSCLVFLLPPQLRNYIVSIQGRLQSYLLNLRLLPVQSPLQLLQQGRHRASQHTPVLAADRVTTPTPTALRYCKWHHLCASFCLCYDIVYLSRGPNLGCCTVGGFGSK